MSALKPLTIFAVTGSIAPIIFYLLEAYYEARNPLTSQVQFSFVVSYIFFYCIQIVLLLKPVRLQPIPIHEHLLYIIFLLFIVLGLFNAIEPLNAIIVGLQLVGGIIFYSRLIDASKEYKKYIIEICLFSNVMATTIAAVIHRTLLDGDYLFSLLQINMPIVLIGYILTVFIMKKQRTKILARWYFAIYLIILLAGADRAATLDQYRLQASPIIISALFIGISLFLHYGYLGKIILTGLVVLFYNNILKNMLANRIGSLEERVLIFNQMAQDTYYFLVPHGFGSSLRSYSIGEHFVVSQGTRGEYPSHSGLASLLYELSVWTLLILVSVIAFKYRFNLINLSYIKIRKLEISAITAFALWNVMYVVAIPSSKPMETNGFVMLIAILAWMKAPKPT